ncbi:MAG: ABC transporter ATP-binding protein [Gammaproteobacteria bacterium]|nr:ABC transporter ATP-binding protein [Gammaproteobacteria bacterium]
MLILKGIDKRFGAVSALSGIDLEVETGDVLGIIGPNGSGKTTLLNIVTGVYHPDAGRVYYEGIDITGWKSHRISNLGIRRTFQNVRLFPTMTVFQNVWVAQHSEKTSKLTSLLSPQSVTERIDSSRIEQVLEKVNLLDFRNMLVKHLPLPLRRRLEIARVLISNAKLILFDEPAGGMTSKETDEIAYLINDIASSDCSCVVIEHKMALIKEVCNRVCVLNFGQKITEGGPEEILLDSRVREAYLGEHEEIDA